MYSCSLDKCVHRNVCVSLWVANTPDRWKRPGTLWGPISPACSEGLFITTNRREQYATARQLHLLPFSRSHSPPLPPTPEPRRLPTVHRATRLCSKDWLHWARQGFRAVAAAWTVFSLPFLICHLSKSENKPHVLFLVFISWNCGRDGNCQRIVEKKPAVEG